jgi:hypothetical protein
MSENTKLWQQVFVTDPAAVKPITGKSYRGNSPKPYWLIERATQTFGPVGIGWGVTVKSERFERLSDTDVLHVAVVSVWYVWEGKRTETFDQMGGTKACYLTSKGSLMVDEDAGKKSVTDGMVKALSMIGFAGDIFTGQWDDSKYVEWAEEQYRPKVTAIRNPKSQMGALEGIGDDLPKEWKDYLQATAAVVTTLVEQGKLDEANAEKYREPMDEIQELYMERFLDSKTRSALRKFNSTQKAA